MRTVRCSGRRGEGEWGGGVCVCAQLGVCVQGGVYPGRGVRPGGCLYRKVFAWCGVCLKGCLPWGCLPTRGVYPEGCLPRGPGGCVYLSMHWGRHPPVDRIIDTRLWKRYLSSTTLRTVKICGEYTIYIQLNAEVCTETATLTSLE